MFGDDWYANQAVAILDNYDLSEYLRLCLFFGATDPHIISRSMSTWFKNPEIDKALNNLSTDKFMEYLSVKYRVVFDEHVSYTMRKPVYSNRKTR